MLCGCFPLAIYFTFGSVYMSMPLSHFVTAYPSPSPYERFIFFLTMLYVEFCRMLFLYLLRCLYDFYLSFYLCGITHLLCMLNHSCVPGKNPTCSQFMILLMCCCIWFASILLRIFASIFIRDIVL